MATKGRSPNYPALGLTRSIELAGKLWEREKRTAIDNETAAKDFGYKGLGGPARVAIGALRQYGLIDKVGAGKLRLSDAAVKILHGIPADRDAALRVAAMNPPLFKELHATHADASDAAMRSHLLTNRGFLEEGAKNLIKAYRDTVKLAKLESGGYTGGENGGESEDTADSHQGENVDVSGGKPDPDKGRDSTGGSIPGVFSLMVPFAKGSINVQVRVTGDAMSPAHLARARKYLELAEQDWDDSGSN